MEEKTASPKTLEDALVGRGVCAGAGTGTGDGAGAGAGDGAGARAAADAFCLPFEDLATAGAATLDTTCGEGFSFTGCFSTATAFPRFAPVLSTRLFPTSDPPALPII